MGRLFAIVALLLMLRSRAFFDPRTTLPSDFNLEATWGDDDMYRIDASKWLNRARDAVSFVAHEATVLDLG